MFRPERHLSNAGEAHDFLPESRGQGHFSFGSGRRFVARLIEIRYIDTERILQDLRRQGCRKPDAVYSSRLDALGVRHQESSRLVRKSHHSCSR